MPLRGADPNLRQTIHQLLSLDYPNYELRIVVDSVQDPAWKLVEETLHTTKAKNVGASSIRSRRTTCGLQCCALSEAVTDLPIGTSVIVTVDGDVQVHPQLLKLLVEPMLDPHVGLTFGNRWFIPSDTQVGSWVRYIWNAAAVVPMYFHGIPWGGCCAIRRDALNQTSLTSVWQRAIVHDAPIKSQLARIGMQVRFVPALMIPISESCSMRFAHDFIKRQMLWTRLYHPNYGPVVAHAMASAAALLAVASLFLAACLVGDWVACLIALGSLLGYLACACISLMILDGGVRHVMVQSGQADARMRQPPWLKLPWLVIITQLVYTSAVIRATFARQVSWRGIKYAIKGPFEIERLNDVGFIQNEAQEVRQESL